MRRYLVSACLVLVGLFILFLITRPREYSSPNVILITIDTTRADALGCYGNKHIQTPIMDALAQSGCRFENCYAQASLTFPSHSSILTGRIPPRHGVHNNSTYRLHSDIPLISESFKANGYDTSAFIGSIILLKEYGLDRGFDLYDDHIVHYKEKKDKKTIVTRRAEVTLDHAWNWMKKQDKPFFSWIHLYDPHWPYEPPKPFSQAYADFPYYGEISYVDLQIGKLVKELKDSGKWSNTLLVITADHGDSLGEHEEKSHGFFCYKTTTHVPLIFSKPLVGNKGRVFTPLVSTVDIMPTILDFAGLTLPLGMDGQNLLESDPRTSYSETFIPLESFYFSPIRSLKTENYSFYKSSEYELYDLQQDPGELKNVVEQHPDIFSEFKKKMELIEAGSLDEVQDVQLDQEMIEMLKSLGYVQDGGTFVGDSGDPYELPSPLSAVKVYREVQNMRSYEDKFPYQCIEKLRALVVDHPDYIMLHKELGRYYLQAFERDKALKELETAASLRPRDPRLHALLGQAFYKFSEFEKSLTEFKVALELDENQLIARYNAARVMIELGQMEPAIWNFNKVLEQNPGDIFSLNNLAYLALEYQHDPQQAMKWMKQARKVNPKHPLVVRNYAVFAEALVKSKAEQNGAQ